MAPVARLVLENRSLSGSSPILKMAEGVGFEPTVSYPTFDFESSALNRAQPPFHLIYKDLQRAEKSGLDNVTVQCCGLKRNHSMKTPTAPSGVRSPTKVQFLYKHMNGSYYVRIYAGGKEKWISLKSARCLLEWRLRTFGHGSSPWTFPVESKLNHRSGICIA